MKWADLDHPPNDDLDAPDCMWPVVVERTLRHTLGLAGMGKQRTLMDWHQTRWAYLDERIDWAEMNARKTTFIEEANALIALRTYLDTGKPHKPRNAAERRTRKRWHEATEPSRRRAEHQRQRHLLRQGHETMKAIRRVLRGQDPLPLLESAPARSSRT